MSSEIPEKGTCKVREQLAFSLPLELPCEFASSPGTYRKPVSFLSALFSLS